MKVPKKIYILLTIATIFLVYDPLIPLIVSCFTPSLPREIELLLGVPMLVSNQISIILFIVSAFIILKATFTNYYIENDIEELRRRLLADGQEKSKNKDILELMLSNMSEIKQYYSISKRHAQLSFILALLFCISGLVLLAYSVSLDKENTQPVIIGLIGSTVSELFAGTALLVHKSSLSQLNHYYQSLHENERFLSTVNLTDRLSKEKQDEALLKIIDSSLTDISSLIKRTEK